MPNWREYPHAEPCPCCGYDVRWASDEIRSCVFETVLECLGCGWSSEETVNQNEWAADVDEDGDDYGDDDEDEGD